MATIVITPAFCKAALLEQSLANYYEYQTENYEHWILVNHYPVNRKKNNNEIRKVAEKFKCKVFDSEYDRGLHNSVNNFYAHNPQPPGSIHIGFDPDSAIEQLSHGFDKALSGTLQCGIIDHSIAFLALWGIGAEIHKKDLINKLFINDNAVIIHPTIEMFSVGAIDLDFIKLIGGFSQPNNYYGGAEVYFWSYMQKYNKKLAYLTEYKERYFAY